MRRNLSRAGYFMVLIFVISIRYLPVASADSGTTAPSINFWMLMWKMQDR
jgi:hypothetical protein